MKRFKKIVHLLSFSLLLSSANVPHSTFEERNLVPNFQATIQSKSLPSNSKVVKKEIESVGKIYEQKKTDASQASSKGSIHWANIVAISTGVISFLLWFFSIPAIVFGAIGLNKPGKGLGIAGLAAGILVFLLFLL
ncbi:MAG: DUF4190 domain-containing protein [Cytophagales bacterium]|nr:DUF4190 domain-containing protein [Cytophagales bacterium]MDW8384225.1 DUF4190 domain-containing protein [Flammeovirgaceae bacterium]